MANNKLVEHITQKYVQEFSWHIYKSFTSNQPLEKEFFYENMTSLILQIPPSIERDMVEVELMEAAAEGYIEYDELEVSGSNGTFIFMLTDKGKDYVFPAMKAAIKDHFSFLIEYIDSLDTTTELAV